MTPTRYPGRGGGKWAGWLIGQCTRTGARVKSVKGVPGCRRHLWRLQSQTCPRTMRKDRNLMLDSGPADCERRCSQSNGITAGESGSVRRRWGRDHLEDREVGSVEPRWAWWMKCPLAREFIVLDPMFTTNLPSCYPNAKKDGFWSTTRNFLWVWFS